MVNDVPVRFLVDTGSSITIISESVLDKMGEQQPQLIPDGTDVLLADGGSLKVQGKHLMKLQFDKEVRESEVWVADIQTEGILGLDFLRESGGYITVGQTKIACELSGDRPRCC